MCSYRIFHSFFFLNPVAHFGLLCVPSTRFRFTLICHSLAIEIGRNGKVMGSGENTIRNRRRIGGGRRLHAVQLTCLWFGGRRLSDSRSTIFAYRKANKESFCWFRISSAEPKKNNNIITRSPGYLIFFLPSKLEGSNKFNFHFFDWKTQKREKKRSKMIFILIQIDFDER